MSEKEHLEALQDIRKMMNRSVRFLSLSGLAGVFAGIYALIAGAIVLYRLDGSVLYTRYSSNDNIYFVYVGIVTLIVTLITSYIFTSCKAKKEGVSIWDDTAKKVFLHLSIPLVTGGIFCLSLLQYNLFGLIAPVTLLFYGMALVNVSKYTYPQVLQLGVFQIVLGLLNMFFIGYGIIFWMIGFGVLHIAYGVYMHVYYDRK